jgi:hypothetical protein
MKLFYKIDKNQLIGENSSLEIQYDYMRAFLDFSNSESDFSISKEIFIKYKDFLISQWKEMFEEIEDQLIQYEGREVEEINDLDDEVSKKKKQEKEVAKNLPKLSSSLVGNELKIIHANIKEITVKFYFIDMEVLFSRTPFISQVRNFIIFLEP